MLGLCGMLQFKLYYEILLLLNMADVGRLCYCGVSKAEYLVHSIHINRLSGCREFCGVHSWQNGTRYRDGVDR